MNNMDFNEDSERQVPTAPSQSFLIIAAISTALFILGLGSLLAFTIPGFSSSVFSPSSTATRSASATSPTWGDTVLVFPEGTDDVIYDSYHTTFYCHQEDTASNLYRECIPQEFLSGQ